MGADNVNFAEASMLLIGMAGLAAGVVGVLMPPGRRLEVVVALMAGAGAGFVVLGTIGVLDLGGGGDLDQRPGLFFVATVAGFITVMISLVVVWRRRQGGASSGQAV